MPETFARDLWMYAGGEQVSGMRVSEIVETNPFQASLGHKPSKGLREANAMNGIIPAKQNRVNKKHAGGMPKFEPTDEQRKTVERAAGFGLPQDKICQLVVSDRIGRPIDDDTLRRHFALELERGAAVADNAVIGALYDKAVRGDTAACIWWTKSKCGWSETSVIKHENSRLDAMSEDEIIKELADRANKLGVKIDVNIGEQDVNIGEQHPHALDRNHRSKRQRRG